MPPPADATNQYHAGVMIAVRCRPNVDLQPIFGQPLGQPSPHSTSVIASAVGVQIKIIHLAALVSR